MKAVAGFSSQALFSVLVSALLLTSCSGDRLGGLLKTISEMEKPSPALKAWQWERFDSGFGEMLLCPDSF